MDAQICKVDEQIGVAFGWAVVSKVNGEPFVDSQNDHVPEDVVLKAAARFMEGDRPARVMHGPVDAGRVIFAWPMTSDVAKAMGVTTKQTGLMIGIKPDDPAVLEKFKNGTYRGFSIGGRGQREEA